MVCESSFLNSSLFSFGSFAGVTKVFVAVDGKAKAVPVTVGTRDKDWVEVTGDLKSGDQILTSGFALVVDGSVIRIRD